MGFWPTAAEMHQKNVRLLAERAVQDMSRTDRNIGAMQQEGHRLIGENDQMRGNIDNLQINNQNLYNHNCQLMNDISALRSEHDELLELVQRRKRRTEIWSEAMDTRYSNAAEEMKNEIAALKAELVAEREAYANLRDVLGRLAEKHGIGAE